METPVQSPVREDLLTAVNEIGPLLRDCAAEGERKRRLSASAVEAIREANLFRCAAPCEVGGLGVDPITQLEVFEAVSAFDGAAGWNLMISAILTEVIGARLGEDAVERMYGGSRFPIAAGLVWPRGRARRAPGGFRVTGQWGFGSGIHQANWVMGGCLTEEPGESEPGFRIVVVPREQVAIQDTWHVAGLRGTGSCDYSIDDAFVPESFSFEALSPGRRGDPWSRLPGPLVTGTGHAGFALGIARGVLLELETHVATARRSMAASRTGDRESFKLALGRHAIAYDAARTLVFSAHRAVWETACRGEPPTPAQVSRLRISGVYATEVAVEAAHFAFRAAGTAALFDASPIQRALRDILAAQQHVYVADSHYVELAEERIAAADTSKSCPPER